MATNKKKAKAKSKVISKSKKTVTKKAPAKKTAAKTSPKFDAAILPTDDRILVRVANAETVTAGGIIIPDSSREKPNRGVVLAVGRGRKNKKGIIKPLDVEVGQTVLYPAYSGTKLEISGEEVLILREEEVLGIEV